MAGKLLIKLSARCLFRGSQLAQATFEVCESDLRSGKPLSEYWLCLQIRVAHSAFIISISARQILAASAHPAAYLILRVGGWIFSFIILHGYLVIKQSAPYLT